METFTITMIGCYFWGHDSKTLLRPDILKFRCFLNEKGFVTIFNLKRNHLCYLHDKFYFQIKHRLFKRKNKIFISFAL